MVDRVRVSRLRGISKKRPSTLAVDKSYDSSQVRRQLRRWSIGLSITNPLKVARTRGWVDNFRGLVTRHD